MTAVSVLFAGGGGGALIAVAQHAAIYAARP